jgi:hypothetical protein
MGRTYRETQWGEADGAVVLARGIIDYSTPSHGGIWLSADRQREIAEVGAKTFRGGLEWWEEDCDWSVPYWFFRDAIRAHGTAERFEENLVQAQATIRRYHPECADRLLSSPAVLAQG